MKPWVTPRRLTILGTVYLVLCVIGGVLLVEISLHPPTLRPVNEAEEKHALEMAQSAGGTLEPVAIQTAEGATLKAWSIEPAVTQRNGASVLLLHGVSDSRIGMLAFAPFLLNRGYSVLLPDARSHGQSGGLATYGLLEREDVRAWARWLGTRGTKGACVYALGESMGAAMLLQSLDGGSQEFCAVVADSSFADFREVAFDRVGQPFGVGDWLGRTALRPLVETAFVYARWKYDLDFRNASPAGAVQASHVPIFLIHGAADNNIPIRHAYALRRANPAALFWEVPGVGHTAAHGVATAEFERRVLIWYASASPSLAAARASATNTPPAQAQSAAAPAPNR